MENENGNDGGQNAIDKENDKDLTLPEIDPDNATPEQVKQLITTAQTALGQKKHWREKAVDPETKKPYRDLYAAAKDIKPNDNGAGGGQGSGLENDVKMLKLAEEKRQFGHIHSLAPEEADHVFAFAQGAGIKPADALEKPFIKNAIEGMRSAARTQGATPGPSSRLPTVEGKTFEQMNTDERRKNFSELTKPRK